MSTVNAATAKTMSFLMQAAALAATQGNEALATSCAATLRRIADKTLTRMTPRAKRLSCRRCKSALISGAAASKCTVRVRKGRVVRRCAACGLFRRFPLPPTIAKKNKFRSTKPSQQAIRVPTRRNRRNRKKSKASAPSAEPMQTS